MARRSDRPIVFVERQGSSPLWWLLAGGALGASLALLFAPEPGQETRRLLAGRLRRLRDSAEEVIDELREGADADEEGEELVEEQLEGELDDEAEEALDAEDDGGGPAGHARAELEKRLAAARARRQRAFVDEDEEPVA